MFLSFADGTQNNLHESLSKFHLCSIASNRVLPVVIFTKCFCIITHHHAIHDFQERLKLSDAKLRTFEQNMLSCLKMDEKFTLEPTTVSPEAGNSAGYGTCHTRPAHKPRL